MEDELKKLEERFGADGIRELAKLDGMGMAVLYRLYLVTSIASNLHTFDEELARTFYNSQTIMVNAMMSDLEKFSNAFQDKRGEF